MMSEQRIRDLRKRKEDLARQTAATGKFEDYKRPVSGPAQLGEETADVYELDISKLSTAQLSRLVDFIVGKFGEPREVVEASLAAEGFPIREADVFLAFDLRLLV